MQKELLKSKTVFMGIITAGLAALNVLTGIITPETADALQTIGLALMGIFLRDGIAKNGKIQ